MSNVNSVTVSGNLTRDPELVTYGEDGKIAKLGIAVNRSFMKGEERVEEVSYFDITVLRSGFAGLVMRKLRKGDACTVQGELRQERWTVGEGDDAKNQSKVVIIALEIDSEGFFRSKDEDNNTELVAAGSPANAEAAEAAAPVADDDIPF